MNKVETALPNLQFINKAKMVELHVLSLGIHDVFVYRMSLLQLFG